MLKAVLIALGGALATATVTVGLVSPAAQAAAPECKNKANKYVACTDKLKAKTPKEIKPASAPLRTK